MSSYASRLRRCSHLFIFVLVVIALSAVAAGAQDSNHAKSKPKPYALLFGTVWDSHGNPVYGVPIYVRRADHKKAQWSLVSDHHGEFAQRVPPGTADYIVWAEPKHKKKGSQPVETKVHIDNDERVDFSLHLTE